MSQPRTTRAARPGSVALVGAGTGDAALLTVRATELLCEAELVVADPRCGEELLQALPETVEIQRTEVGEMTGPALVAASRTGRRVVRLLPGDPFQWPEAVKEAEALTRAKQRLEVVPGVPASVAVPAFAGVAVGLPRTVARVDDDTRFDALAAAPGTLVLLTNAADVAKAAAALVEHGRRAGVPVSVTVAGATPAQRTVTATLDSVEQVVAKAELVGEAVVVVGDPVRRQERASWFERRPLHGWRVLVPRTREQAASVSEALRRHGAVPIEVPTIAVEPPRTPAPMERAVKGLVTGRYLWVAFTSVNAVRAVVERCDELGLDARAFAGVRVAAVGEATAAALRAYGLRPDLAPSGEQSSRGLLEVWSPFDPVFDPMDRVLLPRADIATDALIAGLTALGWHPDDVTAYRTVRAAPPPASTREALKGGGFDAVLFTSSSTVRNLVGIAGKPHDSTVLACIGPATEATVRELGLRPDVVADAADVLSLVDSLARFAEQRQAAGDAVALPSAAYRRRVARAAAKR